MSHDLAVFRIVGKGDAAAIYAGLRGSPSARKNALAQLETSKRPAAFYAALQKQFPELADDDESPFAAEIERSDAHVILNISFSRVEEVAHAVATLASKHDLDDGSRVSLLPRVDPWRRVGRRARGRSTTPTRRRRR